MSGLHRGRRALVARAVLVLSPMTAVAQGPAAPDRLVEMQAIAQALGVSCDFGEDTLLGVAQRLVPVRPAEAIALLELNIEFHPESARSYAMLAYAHTRVGADAGAVTYLEKALALEPDNGVVKGQLEQVRRFQRRP